MLCHDAAPYQQSCLDSLDMCHVVHHINLHGNTSGLLPCKFVKGSGFWPSFQQADDQLGFIWLILCSRFPFPSLLHAKHLYMAHVAWYS